VKHLSVEYSSMLPSIVLVVLLKLIDLGTFSSLPKLTYFLYSAYFAITPGIGTAVNEYVLSI